MVAEAPPIETPRIETARIETPRILLLSQRRLRPSICRTSQNEYEDVIASIDAVEMLSPAPRSRQLPVHLRIVEDKVSRRTGIDFERRPWPKRLTGGGHFDLLFLIVQHPSDLNILHAYPSWREHCRKAIVYIEELWTVELKYEKMLRPLKLFDHILMNTAETVEPLGRLVGRPCDVAHVGVDAIRFCPLPENPRRVIDFLSMGRRGELTHAALMKMARARDFYYEYDTVKAKYVLDSTDHRELLANRIKRCRYFLANKPKVDAKHQRGDQEELGMRYFEGAAGGAVMIGERPKTPLWDEQFGWTDACIDFPYDSPDIEDVIDSLDRQPERVARIRRDNVVNSLRRHDWAYRFQAALELAGLSPHPKLLARLEHLRELAAATEVEALPVSSRVLV